MNQPNAKPMKTLSEHEITAFIFFPIYFSNDLFFMRREAETSITFFVVN